MRNTVWLLILLLQTAFPSHGWANCSALFGEKRSAAGRESEPWIHASNTDRVEVIEAVIDMIVEAQFNLEGAAELIRGETGEKVTGTGLASFLSDVVASSLRNPSNPRDKVPVLHVLGEEHLEPLERIFRENQDLGLYLYEEICREREERGF